MNKRAEEFAQGVMKRYSGLERDAAWKSVNEALVGPLAAGVGHPDFEGLGLGQSASCEMCTVFLDLSGFTARSFWEPPDRLVRLGLAVLGQYAIVVEDFGGYVLGFRGDGLFAGFGGHGSNKDADCAMAMGACAFALDATRGALNELLKESGMETVVARAGAEWGRADFACTGSRSSNEINILGFATNFAAWCEKKANAWDVVIGEGTGGHFDRELLTAHPDSPKSFQHKGERRFWSYYLFKWDRIVSEAASAPSQLRGRPTSSLGLRY